MQLFDGREGNTLKNFWILGILLLKIKISDERNLGGIRAGSYYSKEVVGVYF
jgi:hypothetical protein